MFLIPWEAAQAWYPSSSWSHCWGGSKICFAPAPHQSFSTLSQAYRSSEGRKTSYTGNPDPASSGGERSTAAPVFLKVKAGLAATGGSEDLS